MNLRNVKRHADRSVPFERPFMLVIAALAAACGDDVTEAADSRLWEVYDQQGVYLGAIDLGVTSTPRPRMRGDRIVGTVQDELDVFHVVAIELRTN